MRDYRMVFGAAVCLMAAFTGAAAAAEPEASAAASASAGTMLPQTLSPRVDAERGAVAVASGYDGARGTATLLSAADVQLARTIGARAGFTALSNAGGAQPFQPHVGLRWQLLRQERHGIDGAVALFYRMERFTEDEGMVQLVAAGAHRAGRLGLFANLAYGQDPEGDDRDGEVRLAAAYDLGARLQLGVDGRARFDLFSDDARRAARGETDLDVAAGPLACLSLGRIALLAQAGVSAVRAGGVLHTGLLATAGAASVF